MTHPLHDDNPHAEALTEQGRVVVNLTAEEYAASYADGEPHSIPPEVEKKINSEASRITNLRLKRQKKDD